MALRFHLDRCTASEIIGWIDDDGPVDSIDVELDGNWVCSVSPSLYRPDLESAGYGDGNRGFAFSIMPYLSAAPTGTARFAVKYNGTVLHDGPIGSLEDEPQPPSGSDDAVMARLAQAESQISALTEAMRFEQFRIDAALFLAEGLTHQRDAFLRARATAEYQSVFEKPDPLVSVCISTLDRAELLIERALGSLIAQSYSNLQIIVVGDHCTDDTMEQIARLGDPRISFENLPARGRYPRPGMDRWMSAGAAPANRTLELVRGDFVTHLDDDDTFEPRRIEILLDKIQKTRADLVFHPFWWQEPDGSWTVRGNGRFELTQTGTGMVFYHRYLARIPWDVFCYRLGEPGDWNLLRKFKMMRVRTEFVPEPLTRHYRFPEREPFVPEPGEDYLE